MTKYTKILDLEDCVFNELIENALMDKLGLIDYKSYYIEAFSKKLNLKIHETRYYLNSAFWPQKYKHIRENSKLSSLSNFELNYDILNNLSISSIQYNALLLFFKYKVDPHDIEIYLFIPDLSNIIFKLYEKYPNLINKKGKTKMENLSTKKENFDFKITRSNRYMLKKIYDYYDHNFTSLWTDFLNENPSIQAIETFEKILIGETKKSAMEKLPEFETVLKWINDYKKEIDEKQNTPDIKFSNVKEPKESCDCQTLLPTTKDYEDITNKLLFILIRGVKIKKKKSQSFANIMIVETLIVLRLRLIK